MNYLDGPAVLRHLLDAVSRGGNYRLNVSPDGHGHIPEPRRNCLEQVDSWMTRHSRAVHDTVPLDPAIGRPSENPWTRWTRTGDVAHAVVDAAGTMTLAADPRD